MDITNQYFQISQTLLPLILVLLNYLNLEEHLCNFVMQKNTNRQVNLSLVQFFIKIYYFSYSFYYFFFSSKYNFNLLKRILIFKKKNIFIKFVRMQRVFSNLGIDVSIKWHYLWNIRYWMLLVWSWR